MFWKEEAVSRLIVCAGIVGTFGSVIGVPTALAADNPKGIPASAVGFTVVEHLDGDSFFVGMDDGEKQQVDLLGIDTPELKKNECFDQQSANYLISLIPVHSTVYLEEEEQVDDDSD